MAKEEVGVEVDISVSGDKSLSTLKKDIKAATAEALSLSRQFGENSKQAQDAAKKVAMLRDELADVNERVALFDPGAKFKAFGNVVTTVTAGFTAAQGAMAVFGSESEDLQKQLVKLQGALNLTQGLSAITDSWKDFARLGSVVKGQVVTAFTTLRGALIATGIGALVVALGTIAANFEKIEGWLKKVIPGFEGFGKAFGKVKAVAMGVLNGIIESFKVIGEIVGKVFEADFSGAVETARSAGSRIGKAYTEGFEEEVKDQAEEAARKLVEAQVKSDERLLKVLQAGGEKRAKAAEALERTILENKIKTQKEGTDEYKDAENALVVFDTQKAEERRKQAEEAAQKAIEARKQAGQKALAVLQQQQDLDYTLAESLGKNLQELKASQFSAQLALAKKYGIDTAAIEIEQNKEAIARQAELNKTLSKEVDSHAQKVIGSLQSISNSQANFNAQTSVAQEIAVASTADAERRKQDAMVATNNIMSGLMAEKEQLSDLERGAVIATMLAVEIAEKGKMDAMELTQVGLRIAAKALGEASALGKGVAIANTTIDTIKSASSVFSGMVTTFPGPWGIALGVAGAAAAAIAGFARVKQIMAVKVPGANGGGPGASSPTPGTSAPNITRVQSNTGIMVDQLDQINTNTRNAQRVQVVESDITDAQKRVANVEENAKF